jgi:xylulokinase
VGSNGYLIGYDIGSSSVKASLLDAATGRLVASAYSPDRELAIIAPRPGWAEQHPQTWWKHVKAATARIRASTPADLRDVRAIGISYQMHGLVVVDKRGAALRNAIIWCDSRAVAIGAAACKAIGPRRCLERLLNSPGNFTASKLRWVKDNEPRLYARIHKVMLPGDYVAMQMTGTACTTPSGLSEGILWDFRAGELAALVMKHYGFAADLIPPVRPTFSEQGELTAAAARELGLKRGTPVTYRAGDQPNNAFSLNVLEPGEVAATAGTSGVVYGVLGAPGYDAESRVNTFVHVNHTPKAPRYGMLLCVNGTGILNSWLKHNLCAQGGATLSYDAINRLAATAPPGAEGLIVLPYGNGAERTLGNRNVGASVRNLQLTIHRLPHLLRASQEGIVYALRYGLDIMRQAGVKTTKVRAGNANMFLSPLFCEAFATVADTSLELYNTDGSQGAARGAGVGAGIYRSPADAFAGLKAVRRVEPNRRLRRSYDKAYRLWHAELEATLSRNMATR